MKSIHGCRRAVQTSSGSALAVLYPESLVERFEDLPDVINFIEMLHDDLSENALVAPMCRLEEGKSPRGIILVNSQDDSGWQMLGHFGASRNDGSLHARFVFDEVVPKLSEMPEAGTTSRTMKVYFWFQLLAARNELQELSRRLLIEPDGRPELVKEAKRILAYNIGQPLDLPPLKNDALDKLAEETGLSKLELMQHAIRLLSLEHRRNPGGLRLQP